MTVFVDNDVLIKLGTLDIYDEALSFLSAAHSDLAVLPTARYSVLMPKQPGRAEKRYGGAPLARISTFLNLVKGTTAAPDSADLVAMYGVPGIDDGEAVLFSVARLDGGSKLLTGDKRSLRALADTPRCASIVAALQGRVICLEQIVQGVIQQAGFSNVLQRIAAGRSCDKAIDTIFSSGAATTEATASEGLASYISDIAKGAGGVLVT